MNFFYFVKLYKFYLIINKYQHFPKEVDLLSLINDLLIPIRLISSFLHQAEVYQLICLKVIQHSESFCSNHHEQII